MLLKKINNTLKKYPFFTFILASFLIIFLVNSSQFETIEGKRNRRRRKMKKNNPIKKLRTKVKRNYDLIKEMHPELQKDDVDDDLEPI